MTSPSASSSAPGGSEQANLFHPCFDRILDVVELGNHHVPDSAIHLLGTANIDRLDDVAGLGVDRHRPARAVPAHAFGGGDEAVAVGFAAGFAEGLIDQIHAVIAADREQ